MAGTKWDSRSGDGGGIKTDKDLDGDFKKAAEGEKEIQPTQPDKDESKKGTDQPTKENSPPEPSNPWDQKTQQKKATQSQDVKKRGPGPS